MNFFGTFKRRKKEDPINSKQNPATQQDNNGAFIGGNYEVYGELGHGGFGVVYLVYSKETKSVYALKTFKDEYLEDADTRELFRREANVWVELERHPYIVRASYVDVVERRLYIAMEYIAPNEQGLNTLEGYLEHQPPDLAQSLRWAVQFCYGMEFAYSKGVRCHRDIKPANIMITADKTVKITDFGLSSTLDAAKKTNNTKLNIYGGRVGLSGSIMEGRGVGTPTHMPPEQFINAADCDQRSDIYSFGIVLYQMASIGKLPFIRALPKLDSAEEQARFWKEMFMLHSQTPVPKLASPIYPIIQHCLQKKPNERYQTFKELRLDLEALLFSQIGERVTAPKEIYLQAWEMVNKASSLAHLGHFGDALLYFDKALDVNPKIAEAWSGKGSSLNGLGRFEEAIKCFDQALKIDPRHEVAWYSKGNSLNGLGRQDEAMKCLDQALDIDSRFLAAWLNKAAIFTNLDRFDEVIYCCDKALKIDANNVRILFTKASAEESLGRKLNAVKSYQKFVELAPTSLYPEHVSFARNRIAELVQSEGNQSKNSFNGNTRQNGTYTDPKKENMGTFLVRYLELVKEGKSEKEILEILKKEGFGYGGKNALI